MRALIIGAALAALTGCATTEAGKADAAKTPYTVIKKNVTLPFGSRDVWGFQVGNDDSLILQSNNNRYYRAELDPYCKSLLPWQFAIGFEDGPIGVIDRGTHVVIDRHRCIILALDEIENPNPKKKAAAPAAAASEPAAPAPAPAPDGAPKS